MQDSSPTYIFAGDSWALKAFSIMNHNTSNYDPMPDDQRLADHWSFPYALALAPGKGNLSVVDQVIKQALPAHTPIIWLYTEPGRDYGRITGDHEFNWITREDIFEVREQLDAVILDRMRSSLSNPIGLIGGLSDINADLANKMGFTVLHYSWQRWIADRLQSKHFRLGWGACDIGWRSVYNNVQPSKAATFAWDEQIKEWCWWEEQGYFFHEHPTPKANQEFAQYLQLTVENWLNVKR